MSAQANITVYDGAATPVSHTLVPVGVTSDPKLGVTAKWEEKLASVPDEANIRFTLNQRTLPSGVRRIEGQLEVPVMESVSGNNAAGYTAAPKVAYIDTLSVVGYHHPRSTISGRRLVRQMLINLMGNVATSVAPATAGFVPELQDQHINAS